MTYRSAKYRNYYSSQTPYATLTPRDGGLALDSSYSPGLVAELKSKIPVADRRWDGDNKLWIVTTQYGKIVADLALKHLGVVVAIPQVYDFQTSETRTIKLEYLGQAKERADGTKSAFGYSDGGWNVIIPLRVLQRWFIGFEVDDKPNQALTYYQVLGIKRGADESTIKTAFRRLAKQWHPDVCRESDADQQFRAINHAYSVLSDSVMRQRYDAGLTFQSTTKDAQSTTQSANGWRSPLRCGWVLANGRESLGRFVVSEILAWEDITDDAGRVMSTSWQYGDDQFTVRWI